MSILKRFLSMAGIDAGGHTIIHLADPVDLQDAATKASTLSAIAAYAAGLPGVDTGITIGGGGAGYFDVAPVYAIVHDGGTSTGGGSVVGDMTSGSVPTTTITGGLSNG